MSQTVAILGASEKPERYSYKAFLMLQQYGHRPLPISPHLKVLEGVDCFASLSQIVEPVDTLTMYVGAQISKKLSSEILLMKPKRVIFNPGSENPELQTTLEKYKIQVLEACTLVLLRTNQFEF